MYTFCFFGMLSVYQKKQVFDASIIVIFLSKFVYQQLMQSYLNSSKMHVNLTLICYIVPITTKQNISDTVLIVFMVTLVPNTTTLLLVMKLHGQVLKTNTGVSKSTHRRNPHLSTFVWKKKISAFIFSGNVITQ